VSKCIQTQQVDAKKNQKFSGKKCIRIECPRYLWIGRTLLAMLLRAAAL